MVVGFMVSVPLKQLSIHDTPSRTEISFQWDILLGDFYDRVCARMDLDPKDGILGYKFEGDAKKSIVQLPSNDPVAFDSMLEKVKSVRATALHQSFWSHRDRPSRSNTKKSLVAR